MKKSLLSSNLIVMDCSLSVRGKIKLQTAAFLSPGRKFLYNGMKEWKKVSSYTLTVRIILISANFTITTFIQLNGKCSYV